MVFRFAQTRPFVFASVISAALGGAEVAFAVAGFDLEGVAGAEGACAIERLAESTEPRASK